MIMKLKDLIVQLQQYNQEADVSVIAHNQREDFSLAFEGVSKEACKNVSFYVDRLNDEEDEDEEYESWDFTDFDPI
jgi:hypothetical protein